jgi:hypothetical protein
MGRGAPDAAEYRLANVLLGESTCDASARYRLTLPEEKKGVAVALMERLLGKQRLRGDFPWVK